MRSAVCALILLVAACTGQDVLVTPGHSGLADVQSGAADAPAAAELGADAPDLDPADADLVAADPDVDSAGADLVAVGTDADAEAADLVASGTDADAEDADLVALGTDADAEAVDLVPTGSDADVAPPQDTGPDSTALCPYGLLPQKLCLHWGVCSQGVAIKCAGSSPICDYGAVAGFEEVEHSCDGLDNDCNALTDDDLPAPPAENTWGVCAGAKSTCAGGLGWQAPDLTTLAGYEATEASCDGLDNDCDGLTDDLANAVFPKDAKGVCAGVPLQCLGAQGWQMPQDPVQIPDFQSTETTCDGLDNDCDGKTDANLWTPLFAGGPSVPTAGVCAGVPLQCAGGQWQAPDVALWQVQLAGLATPTYQAIEQACDGLDNDCDGQTDFALQAPPASKQLGVCAGKFAVCKGKLGWQEPNWFAVPGYSDLPDWLCDGLDNDCDGQTDEDAICPLWQSGGRGLGQVALSPDGQRLAWTSLTGVHVVDAQTGARLNDHYGHGYEVTGVDFAPDGTQLASVGRFDVLRIWDAQKSPGLPYLGKTAVALQWFGSTYTAVAWAPDGARVAVADQAGIVRLFALWSGQQIGAYLGQKAPIQALAWVQAGPQKNNRLVWVDASGALVQWDTLVGGGKVLGQLANGVAALAADPASSRVLATGKGLAPQVWNVETGKLETVLGGTAQPAVGGQWTGAANEALTIDSQGEVRRWLVTGPTVQASQVWPGPDAGEVVDLAVQGTIVVAGLPASGPWRLDLQTGKWSQPELRHLGAVRTLAVSQGVLASAGDDATVRLRQALTGAPLLDLQGHDAAVNGVTLLVNPSGPASMQGSLQGGAQLASGSVDFSVRLWQVVVGGQGVLAQKTFGLGGPWPEDLRTAPGQVLWIAGGPGVQAFSMAQATLGQKLATYTTGFPNLVQSATPSPDGARVLLGMTGQGPAAGVNYRMLDGKTLKVLWDAKLPADRHVAAWRPDGTQVAVTGGGPELALLDAQTGKIAQELWGHSGAVLALAWATGGTRLLSASADGTARVWRTTPGEDAQSAAVWTRHCPQPCKLVQVQAVAWLDAAGKVAFTAGSDGAVFAVTVP